MKILRIIARLNVGGPARHVVWLTEALQNEQFQTTLIAGTVPEGEEDMRYFADEHGVQPVSIPEMSRELSLKDVISLVKVYRTLRAVQPDIVHTHTAKAGTVGRLSAFAYRWLTWKSLIGSPRKVKIIHTFHGHVFHSYYGKGKTRVFLAIERLLARFATDKIITISDQQCKEIADYGVGRKDQFEVVPLGIDLAVFGKRPVFRDTIRAEFGAADPDDVLVGFVGRLTEIKNLSHLLRVISLYKEKTPSAARSLKFVIIGDGHLRPALEAEAASLGISDLLRFAGNRTDVADFYSALDIVALTSRNEGTPLSLIEGMASAKPVISTGVGGVVDLLGKVRSETDSFRVCERGVRIDSESADDFLSGLLYLARDAGLRESLARRGEEYVKAEYSKERLVHDISSLYLRLLPSAAGSVHG